MSGALLANWQGRVVLIRVEGLPPSWTREEVQRLLNAVSAGLAVVLPTGAQLDVVGL